MAEEESTIDLIRHLRRQEPFIPFEIVMSSGDRCLVENPDALAIATSQIHYYPPRSGAGIHLRINQIAIVHQLGEKPAA
jgi:hypothetical protein